MEIRSARSDRKEAEAMMKFMASDDLATALDYLELNDVTAALVFDVLPKDISDMRAGLVDVPFLVSAMTVLMCESRKATQLAIEHGLAMMYGEPSIREIIARSTDCRFTEKCKSAQVSLRVIEGDKSS